METTVTELFVILDEGKHATLSAYPTGDRRDSAAGIEHYLVSGPRPVFRNRGTQHVADFDAWRESKEAEGFLFEPLAV